MNVYMLICPPASDVVVCVGVLAEDIFDVVATPPCTPASDVVVCVGVRADDELGDGVSPLLLEQRPPEVVVGRPVEAVVLLLP
jgi:hypothetical protein